MSPTIEDFTRLYYDGALEAARKFGGRVAPFDQFVREHAAEIHRRVAEQHEESEPSTQPAKVAKPKIRPGGTRVSDALRAHERLGVDVRSKLPELAETLGMGAIED